MLGGQATLVRSSSSPSGQESVDSLMYAVPVDLWKTNALFQAFLIRTHVVVCLLTSDPPYAASKRERSGAATSHVGMWPGASEDCLDDD